MTVSFASYQSLSQILQIGHSGIHPRHIFINKCPSFDFSGRLVGNKVLAESWQLLKKFAAPPEKSHVRSKNLIPGTYQVITIESLHINYRVWPIVHTIEKNLGASFVRELGRHRNVYDRAKRI